jgi:hypothetical protein
MTEKHTPGPWWITDHGVRDSGGYICHTKSVQRYADQDERYVREVAQREADKHLIAAAPDLLASLRDMVEWLDDGNRQLSESAAADVAKARSALSRATGEAA